MQNQVRPASALREFLESEAAGGVILVIVAVLTVHLGINDALMAVLLLLV